MSEHITFPKPPKRGRKAPKGIKRSTKPIDRTKRPPRVSASPARKAELAADAKWSAAVRAKGPCFAFGYLRHALVADDQPLSGPCRGEIQACHVHSKRFKATRDDVRNGQPMCAAAHDYFTRHDKEWKRWAALKMGPLYEELRLIAIAGPKATA